MSKRLPFLAILLIAAPLALAGCGGGDSDEDEIVEAIETTATTNEGSNCIDLQTQRFVEQIEFTSGQAAVENCKNSGPETNADSVEVSNVEVDGDTATAEVAVTGASFDGQTLEISLVKEGDQWKLDHLDGFVDFDQQALANAFEELLPQGDDPATPAQARCFAEKIASAPAATVERVMLSGDEQQLAGLFGSCFR